MKEKVIYIAEDGKEFENKEDCVKYESKPQRKTDIFKYISFYDLHKNKIQLDSFMKKCFIQRNINYDDDYEFYNAIEEFLEKVYFIHVSEIIPNKELESLIEQFMESVCDGDLSEITRFDFEKGITYYYDIDIECYTNTIYEKEQIEKQLDFLTELENLD